MIGFQCTPPGPPPPASNVNQQQQQQHQEQNGASSPASRRSSSSSTSSSASTQSSNSSSSSTNSSGMSPSRESTLAHISHLHHQLPQIQQHTRQQQQQQQHCHSPTSLANQLKLLKQNKQKTDHQQDHNHSHNLEHHHQHQTDQRANSPGYHSASSSPGSSSIASPVFSSASSSSSSGISTASLLSTSTSPNCQPSISKCLHNPTTTNSVHQAQLKTPLNSIVSSMGSVTSIATNQHQHQHQHQQQTLRVPQQQRANQQTSQSNSLASLLDFFPETQHDSLNISWFHDANNRNSLNAALTSRKLIVAGDISLAEMSRYPVPIMARPPLGVSDLTLENWITDVLQARKGIKLTFTSTRTVEPAFRVLARHAEQLKGPLILSADILARPSVNQAQQQKQQQQQQQQPVDAWTFLMLCRTRFPKSIISIGWCPASSVADLSLPDSTSQPIDSMFELDMLNADQTHHQFSSPVLHLSSSQQHLRNSHQFQPNGHQSTHLLNRQLAIASHRVHSQQQQQHQFGATNGLLLSSNGSLNSSSGNSSGSPSPTSPVGHLLLSSSLPHAGARQILNPSGHQHKHCPTSSTEQLILAAAAAHAAASAKGTSKWSSPAVAAATIVAQLQQQQRDLDEQQEQLPLNLNINEADPQHAVSTLNELAQTIQSLQQQSNSLGSISNSLQQHQQSSEAAAAALALARKLFSNQSSGNFLEQEPQKWEHVSKKAALCNRLNSNSPSPVSTSPKQQQQTNLLSCVAKSQANKMLGASARPTTNCQMGYTREMIDKMSSLVKEYNLTQAITFPVEARWLTKRNLQSTGSLSELQRLLYQVGPNATLTIVAQQEDLISVDELMLIRKHFAPQQILFDLPDELLQGLKNELALDC